MPVGFSVQRLRTERGTKTSAMLIAMRSSERV